MPRIREERRINHDGQRIEVFINKIAQLFNSMDPSPFHEKDPQENTPEPEKENPKLLAQMHTLVPREAVGRIELENEIIESGNPAEAIVQAAERFGADVICLDSYGRSGIAKTLLGSVAQSVTQQSKRPVFAVDEYVDAAVIFAVVIVNAIVGFLQERKAEKAIAALGKTLMAEARVRHDEVLNVAIRPWA